MLDAADQMLEQKEQQYGEEVWALVERLVLLRTIDQLWVDHLTELDDFRRGVGLRGYGGTDPLNEFKREAFQLYEELRGFIRHQVASTIFRVSVQKQEPPPPPQPMALPSREQLAALRASTGSGNGSNGAGCGSTPRAPATRRMQAGAAAGAGPASGSSTGSSAAPLKQCCPDWGRHVPGRYDSSTAMSRLALPRAAGSQPASAAKLGRNDPCWCGSGKKYKKCHGA